MHAGPSYVPHAALTALIAIWAVSFVVAKVAMVEITPFALVASRFLVGALCILPFFVRTTTAQRRAALGPGVLAGLVLAVPYFLQMYGVRETTASMGGFVTGLIVVLVALGGRVFFGARFGVPSVVGLAFGVAGIAVLCATGDDDPSGVQVNTVRGIVLQVGAAIGFAAHILLLSHFGRSLSVAAFTFWQLAFTGALATAGALGVSGISADGGAVAWDVGLLLAIAYLGVLATGVAIGVQTRVQHRIPPTHVALLFALQPLFAAIAGWLLQGDRLGPLQWIGGALIVAGVVVTAYDRPGVRAPAGAGRGVPLA